MFPKVWYGKRELPSIMLILVLVLPSAYIGVGKIIYDQVASADPECATHNENLPEKYFPHYYDGQRLDYDLSEWWFSEYQNQTFPSLDEEITISAWTKEVNESSPWIILVHGIRSCKKNHEVLLPAGMLVNAGYNVLLMDMRDHGDSTLEDGRVSAGIKEYRDVLAAWNWLIEIKGIHHSKIGFHGASMGASTVSIAFAEEPLIHAAFLDTSYYDMERIIKSELKFSGIPEFFAGGGILAGKVFDGVDITKHAPNEAAESVNSRYLFIAHNKEDKRINIVHGEDMCSTAISNVDENGFVDCWFSNGTIEIKGAESPLAHISTMLLESYEYESRLIGFFDKAFFID